jgi:hypothetical protein
MAAAGVGRQHRGRQYFVCESGQPTVDLGSSRIGSVQIQYLDIKFKQ